MRRRWLVVSVAVVALALLVAGGAVFAASNGDDDGTGSTEQQKSKEEFTNRVAEILGKDPAEVKSAVQQARLEQQEQALNSYLDKMVENGRITQEEADQIKQWLAERPEALSELGPGLGFGGRPFFHGRPFGRHHFFKGFPCPEKETPNETPSETSAATSF